MNNCHILLYSSIQVYEDSAILLPVIRDSAKTNKSFHNVCNKKDCCIVSSQGAFAPLLLRTLLSSTEPR